MQSTYSGAFLPFIWRPENDGQGFHDTPGDPGGATSWGVTYRTYLDFLAVTGQPAVTLDAFALLPQSAFEPVYRRLIWNPVRGDDLPLGVDLMVGNFACGAPAYAPRELQAALGVAVDGIIGPITLGAARAAEPASLIERLRERFLAYYRSCGDWPLFGHGWTNRLDACRAASLALVEAV